MALIDYDFAVQFGLQEGVRDVSHCGVQVNSAFDAGDTLVYIPLIALSIVGLIQRRCWPLLTAAVMGYARMLGSNNFIYADFYGCYTRLLS
jgi:hypothetical protein